jgi:DNA-binding NarL/FixJ family response regulator
MCSAGTDGASTPAGTSSHGLTNREREVLSLLATGASNRGIADTLFISVKTAGVHVSNILRKLEVANRAEATSVAIRDGLVS